MNGPNHYKEAERIIKLVNDGEAPDTMLSVNQLLAFAQVHATLALTAATAYEIETRYHGDETGSVSRAWSGALA